MTHTTRAELSVGASVAAAAGGDQTLINQGRKILGSQVMIGTAYKPWT